MARLRSVGRVADEELRSQVHFCADSGQIWLHEHRMLLVHAEAQASLRKELIDTLGMDRARGLLTRMGYASGSRDAELARTRAQNAGDVEAFMTGPLLHTLEGIVRWTPVRLQIDRVAGSFDGEFVWENSWEGQWHRHYYGIHHEPVCWTQIGYACGYASAFMGRTILFKEVECTGAGDNACRVIGKPQQEWDDAAEQMRFFAPASIADELFDLQDQLSELRSRIDEKEKLPAEIVGTSKPLRDAYGLLQQAAPSLISVLLLGETGVGKELFARRLHEASPRRDEAFVAINCAAIPPDLVESELFGVERGAYSGALVSRYGRFERADGGTLFLDEIGDLPLTAQGKLLRVLQDGEIERLGDQRVRKIDVRIVAATNHDLQLLADEGKFRRDLYYRLNAYLIRIPPLRERNTDIPALAKRFLAKYSALHCKKLRGFSDKAKRALLNYAWPGNVRELQNMVERGVILAPGGTRIEVDHLFSACTAGPANEYGLDASGELGANPWQAGHDLREAVFDGHLTLEQLEAMLIETAIDKARGNLSSAARMLGLTRPQIAYRLKRLHASDGDQGAGETTEQVVSWGGSD